MQRPGIGDDQRHAGSEAEPLQVAAVALQIVCRVCAEDAVPGQKLIELGAGGKTKQPAQFDPAEMPLPEFVERQRFEHAAFDLAAGAEAPGEICGDADGDFRQGGGGAVVHIFFLPRRRVADIIRYWRQAERARDMRQSPVYVLNHSQHNFRQRTTQEDLDEIEDWTDRAARRMYEGAGLGSKDVDIFNPYDGYAPMAQFFLEAFQWHGVKRGDAFAFYAGDIRVEEPHPFSSSGGNLGNGRTRTAMYTDSIEQLRGTAGARQVRVRAETALAAFTTPSNGGWIMFGKDAS